ncbi:MAG: ribosome biogenesis GTPase Der [Pseudomonadota bacterium]
MRLKVLPVIAIVGQPNVGKSTLFNRLTRSRNALVANEPGLTRDRQYGRTEFEGRAYLVVDTGGIGAEGSDVDRLVTHQAQIAIDEADAILFVLDARAGVNSVDQKIADQLRRINKPTYIVLNKTDGLNVDIAAADFYQFGFETLYPISATHGDGVRSLLQSVLPQFPQDEAPLVDEGIKVAIVGKPNVGKSTLINRILGEERVMVCDLPGTTRDSIFIAFERRGKKFTLIDTAGIRRRTKVQDVIEKFSVIKALQSIEVCHVVLFIIDAREGIVDQDLRLLGHVLKSGKALVLAINKWDGMHLDDKKRVKSELDRRLTFLDYAKIHFISALHGTGVGNLFASVERAYRSATQELSTPELTKLLEQAVEAHQPPLVSGRRIKLRYAHAGGHNPQRIVIHGKQVKSLPGSYVRYLEGFYRKALKIVGAPIRIELRADANPYVDP